MPVLGYNTAGASSRGDINIARGTPSQTDGIGGTVRKWHCAIAAIGSPADIKLAVYNCDQADGNPSSKSLVEQIEYVVAVSDDESESAAGIESVEADTWYLLCIIMKNANTLIKYDNFGGDKNYWYKVCVYADQYPDPADAGWVDGAASLYSIWVDYQHPGVLGYDIAGVSGSHGIVGQYRGINDIVDSIGGKIKRFHCAVFSVDAVNKNVKMAVADCAQDDGDPSNGAIIEQIEFEVDVGDDEWANAAGDNEVSPDTKYYIAFAVPDTDTKIKYDAINECWYDWGWAYGDVFPDPLDVAHTKGVGVYYSIWADYEPPPPPVEDPVFDPIEGEYVDFVDVTITCATEGATIKYTVDGSTPTPTHGTEYTEPVHITETLTLKAIAYKAEFEDSNVVSGLYTIKELWREIIEFDSPITKKIEFDSPITKEIEFDSPITKIIEFDSEVNNG